MDDLDRLYHRLLDAVREGAPQLRERRFRLGDIPQHLLPYRLHRRDLGFEGVQQYEQALARLAAGERGYLSADVSVQQAFRRAVDDGAAAAPGPGAPDSAVAQALRSYGDALVALAPTGRTADATPEAGVPAVEDGSAPPVATEPVATEPVATEPVATDDRRPVGADGADGAPAEAPRGRSLEIPIARVDAALDALPSSPADSAMPFPVRPPAPVQGGRCPHCGRPLPTARAVTFCPYCGENLTVRRCPACSTELEAGWRFCITCGREVDDPAPAGAAGA